MLVLISRGKMAIEFLEKWKRWQFNDLLNLMNLKVKLHYCISQDWFSAIDINKKIMYTMKQQNTQ